MNKIFTLVIVIIMFSLMYADLEETINIIGSGASITETRVDSNYSALDISIAF